MNSNIWSDIKEEISLRIDAEPSLKDYLESLILSKDNIIEATAAILASKLHNDALSSIDLYQIILSSYNEKKSVQESLFEDILFFRKNVACFLNVALEAVVKDDLLVAKNTLSGTPEAKYSTVSLPVYTSPSMSPDFFAVEHALKIKVAKITSNIFFKFLLNIIFSPGFVVFISNYLMLFKCILHKIIAYFDKREDQDGSEASVSVLSLLSL